MPGQTTPGGTTPGRTAQSTPPRKHHPSEPVTAVSVRTVQAGHEADYGQWTLRVVDQALAFPHSLGATVLSPEPGSAAVRRIAYTFDAADSLHAWEESAVRRRLSDEADAFSTEQPRSDVDTSSPALSVWAPPPPAKWKMALATFVVAYVLTAVVIPLEQMWFPRAWPFLATNVITNVLLALGITYLGLPLVNVVLKRWLNPPRSAPAERD